MEISGTKKKQSRRSGIPPALKHGGYSALALLPGEDEAEFVTLYKTIEAELLPDGPIETHAMKVVAESLWRVSHLSIFKRAQRAREKYGPYLDPDNDNSPSDEDVKKNRNENAAKCEKEAHELKQKARRAYRSGVTEGIISQILTEHALKDAEESARLLNISIYDLLKRPSDDYELAMLGDVATIDHLHAELDIMERLEARASRAMKTLMQAKAMKQILGTAPAPASNQNKGIART